MQSKKELKMTVKCGNANAIALHLKRFMNAGTAVREMDT